MSVDKIVPSQTIEAPYHDDFDENKGFQRVLFRPAFAVQARELTQLQTILQKQIQRFGEHVFKNGSMVTGGQISYQSKKEGVFYLNLQSTYANTTVVAEDFIGKSIVLANSIGSTANISPKAIVLAATELNDDEPATLVVKYTIGDGSPSSTLKFNASDEIRILDETTYANLATSAATGNSSIANINEGVYFFNGYFLKVLEQTIPLDKYSNNPSYKVGLEFDDSIVTENNDTSLFDPAQESSNWQAPGARRYKVELTLAKRSIDSTDDLTKFIELLRVENDVLKFKAIYPIYSELEKTFARRTYDESGHYTVRPFVGKLSDHIPQRLTGAVTGSDGSAAVTGANTLFKLEVSANSTVWINNRSYTVSSIASNTAMTLANTIVAGTGIVGDTFALVKNQEKFSFVLSPGKAYVSGFEYETIGPTNLHIKRGRSYANVNNYDLESPIGNYIYVTNSKGIPEITEMETMDLHRLRRSSLDLTNSTTYNSSKIGTVKVRSFEYSSASNTSNSLTHIYAAYLFDVNISNSSFELANVKSIISLKNSASPDANAYNKMLDIDSSSMANTDLNSNTTFVIERNTNSLVYPFPQTFIVPGTILDQDYRYRKIESSVSFASGQAVITVSSPESFVGSGALSDLTKLSNFTVVVTDKGNLPASFANGDIVPVTTALGRSITVSPATTATLDINLANNFTANIIYSADITGTAPSARVKTIRYANTQSIETTGGTVINNTTIYTGNANVQVQITGSDVVKTPGNVQTFYVSDVKRLIQVLDFGGLNVTAGNLSSSVDITTSYELYTGQKDSYYDHGGMRLKAGKTLPVGPLLAYFDYYLHSGTSGYLSVDSYPNASTNDGYSDIPVYRSPETGIAYQLRDCIDWRPVRQNAVTANTLLNPRVLQPGQNYTTDLSYYLSRSDKIVLTSDRTIKVLEGLPALYPGTAPNSENEMVLYILKVPPFTVSHNDVDVRYKENKRYTMRDIGKLEKRIENMEYYTALNMLEKTAEAVTILDSNGLNRFKNGIVTDTFTGHKIGNVFTYDYAISMDFQKGQARPPFNEESSRCYLNGPESGSNFVNNRGMVTLGFTLEEFISQPLATRALNINPFNIISYVGTLSLTPDNDTWRDTNVNPQVLVNLEGDYDNWEILANAWGTQWNDWTVNHIGTPTVETITSTESFREGTNTITREISDTTTTTPQSSSRTGNSLYVQPEKIETSIGESVVDVSVLPYMRSKKIVMTGAGLKPGVTVYPFFDGTMVQGWLRKLWNIKLDINTLSSNVAVSSNNKNYIFLRPNASQNVSLKHEVYSNSGGVGILYNAEGAYANGAKFDFITIDPSNTNFFAGDTITIKAYDSQNNATITATANITQIYAHSGLVSANNSNTSQINLSSQMTNTSIPDIISFLVGKNINIPSGKGNGQVSLITSYNTITQVASVSPAWDTVPDTTSSYSIGLLVTGDLGFVTGILNLPSNTFFAGQKKIRLSSSFTDNTEDVVTYADAIYYSQGLLQNKEEKILSQRVPKLLSMDKYQEQTLDITSKTKSVNLRVIPDPVIVTMVPAYNNPFNDRGSVCGDMAASCTGTSPDAQGQGTSAGSQASAGEGDNG